MNGYIYLASPYSHKSKKILLERVRQVKDAVNWLRKQGYNVFSPIAYSHQFAVEYGAGEDYESWRKFNEAMISGCAEFWQLELRVDDVGWKDSVGCKLEIEYAISKGKKVLNIYPSLDNNYRWSFEAMNAEIIPNAATYFKDDSSND